MNQIMVGAKNGAYPVVIGKGLDLGGLARGVAQPCKAAVISDSTVFGLYGADAASSLEGQGFAVSSFTFPAGEASKTLDTIGAMLGFLAENGFTRSDLVVSLGGGVTGDMAGFAASIYMRGIAYVQAPTTLLAAVDSSVGGKTGVDLAQGKNLAGSFYSPKGVFCDIDRFSTLPQSVVADGFAEIIKYAFIADRALYEMLDQDAPDVSEIISRCVSIKAGIVSRDEHENGERQLLNFGHTVGHAVESLSGYAISHGSAVAMGMRKITALSEHYGFAKAPCLQALEDLLKRYGLPFESGYTDEAIAARMLGDKKRRGGKLNFIMLQDIGRAVVHPVPEESILSFIGGSYDR